MKNGNCEMVKDQGQMGRINHFPFHISNLPFEMVFWMLLFIVLAPAGLRAQARIEGQVVNGTTQRPVANQKVIVLVPRQGMQQVADVTTDANGRFAVAQSGIEAGSFYLLQANFAGVPYHAPAPFDATGAATVKITVYDSTREPSSIRVSSLRVAVAAQGQKIRVQEQYQIENTSHPERTYANDEGTFVFQVPAQSGEPKVAVQGLMNMTVPLSPERGKSAGEYKIRYALKPGLTPVTVEYEADYSSASFAFNDRAAYPIGHAEILVLPSSLKVDSKLFQPTGVDTTNDIQKLEAENIPRGTPLEMLIRGEAAAQNPQQEENAPEGTVKVVPNTMTRLGVPLLVCFLLILLWALGVRASKEWPRWKERQAASPANKQLEARADALFNSLADLDELFASGKVEKKKYWKERLELKAKLMAILKKSPSPHSEPYATRRDPR